MSEKIVFEGAQDHSSTAHLVSFTVGRERFGVDILAVQEIIRMVEITKMPSAPEYVEGIINLRGKVIPVVDFRKRFNMDADHGGDNQDRRIVVGDFAGVTIGLIVDEVSHVIKLAGEEISPPPGMVMGVDSTFIRGVGKLKYGLLILLSLEKLFSPGQLEEISQAA